MDNNSELNLPVKEIYIFDAEPGMTIAQDILSQDGSLIAASGTILSMETISKISACRVLEIKIYDLMQLTPAPKPNLETTFSTKVEDETLTGKMENDPNSAKSTYYDKVRQSPEYKNFESTYKKGVNNLKIHLNELVTKHSPTVDEEALASYPNTLLCLCKNKLQVFDMLHSLRNFDDLTYSHSVNVALISSIIGQWMRLPVQDIHQLTIAGMVHDIGKTQIPDEILNKPGKLTDQEFAIMKKHVDIGYDILKNKQIDNRIREAALFHHEKCDGSGYPFGLSGDKIPTFAKILAVADIYDALTADRIYRKAVCPFTAIRMLEEDSFTKLDPKYTLPFLRNVVSSYIHNNVKLDNGEIGEVVMINDRNLSRPIVKINNRFIDLSTEPKRSIIAIV